MVAQSLMAQGFANTMQMYGASAAEDQIGRGHGPLGHAQRLPPGQRGRNGRDENRSQYVINLGRVRAAEDGRTTLMVKNIPNKYTQRMLLETVQQSHAGKFALFYLPIDFKNRCNVGYAFINFTHPESILAFYEEFNGRKWARFNSDKVCEIAYARIQGKAALITHFTHSSLAHEDESYRPLAFASDGSGRPEQFM